MDETKTIVNEEQVIDAPEGATEEVTEVRPGEKTDSALLLKSLHEERDKRRDVENRLKELEAELSEKTTPEVYSDEGKALQSEVNSIKAKLADTELKATLHELQVQNPALKDKMAEFELFRTNPENAGMNLRVAAKAFLVENDLIESPKQRKGLEKDTGGSREPVREGYTSDEVAQLRQTDYRKYTKMLRDGKISL